MNQKIYLDYNATAPIRPEVIEIMQEVMSSPHNASSVHSFGREGRSHIERAREQVAAFIGAQSNQIIFNAGATEGNNTVLNHFADERILVSAIEHPSILQTSPKNNHIPVTLEGIIDLETLETLLKAEKTALVSVMLVNNETGIIQPVQEAAALAHRHGALFHCDAVQASGRIPVDMSKLGIDFLTLSAHKLGGPQGVGALALGLCGITPKLLHGGGQEKSARAGTQNVAGIVGFGLASQIAREELPAYDKRLEILHAHLEDALHKTNGIKLYGQNVPKAANTTLLSMPGISSETLLMALDLDGVAVSNGSACSSGRVEPSHVLKAMGASDIDAYSAIRISSGWNTTQNDIDRFIEVWQNIITRIQQKGQARA